MVPILFPSQLEDSKLQRVASYRHLQAISNQVRLLTNGRFESIDSFKVPTGLHIDPITANHDRLVHQQGDRLRAYFRNSETGETTFLLPAARNWFTSVPLLVLQLDQGPSCCAAAAQPS